MTLGTMAALPAATLDEAQMARALALAARGLYTTDPNPRVGCVLLREGRVLGEGWHQRAGEPHAEVLALRAAGGEVRGATAYVTLEPCSHTGRTPPCADALIAAGIARVVCATADPNPKVAGKGLKRLQAAGINVSVGLMADAARELNTGFFSRFERGRPFIRLKLAMSLDARTAPAAGGRQWITGEGARADVQAWRARSSVVLTGAGTVRVDDPRLDVRLSYGPWIRQPLRVVLDPDLSCPPGSKIFNDADAVIFAAAAEAAAGEGAASEGAAGESRSAGAATCKGAAATAGAGAASGSVSAGGKGAAGESASADAATGKGAAFGRTVQDGAGALQAQAEPELLDGRIPIVRVPRGAHGLDLRTVIERLTLLEVNELLVECGPRLAAAFLQAGLVDELILYVAPTFLGFDAAPLAVLSGVSATPLPRFVFRDQRLIEGDLRLLLTPKKD